MAREGKSDVRHSCPPTLASLRGGRRAKFDIQYSCSGFTFIEVLIALGVVALLITVSCMALIHVLRTEKRSKDLGEARHHLQTVACRAYLDLDTPSDVDALIKPGWTAEAERRLIGENEEQVPWMVWAVRPVDETELHYAIAVRAGLGPWRAAGSGQ
jgi:prepilin-type N-terminal cleavage/methylation domain-containing protein